MISWERSLSAADDAWALSGEIRPCRHGRPARWVPCDPQEVDGPPPGAPPLDDVLDVCRGYSHQDRTAAEAAVLVHEDTPPRGVTAA